MLKPLLRWAGGKRWLTKEIHKYLPGIIRNYYEPFCGSCSIYYSIKKYLGEGQVYLSDLNGELINFYRVLQTNPAQLIDHLVTYENTERFYYYMRGKIADNEVERAARFYYLNRTSFNGIYRENLSGEYNVPYGFKKYMALFDYDLIFENSSFLKDVVFVHDDFRWSEAFIGGDDFVFVDPPYTVSHNKNGFIKYNKKLFSLMDQKRLKDFLEILSGRRARYLLTNAHHDTVYEIFSVNAVGVESDRYTPISGGVKGREFTKEYIFTNYGFSCNGVA